MIFPKIPTPPSIGGVPINSDIEAIEQFLSDKKPNTRKAFERELNRFIVFLESNELTLKDVNNYHLTTYKALLAAPPSELCGKRTSFLNPDGSRNESWKPFIRPLSDSSIATSFRLLSIFFNWLINQQYCKANPVGNLAKPDTKPIRKEADRGFTETEWEFTLSTLKDIEYKATKLEKMRYSGLIFALTFLRETGVSLTVFATLKTASLTQGDDDAWLIETPTTTGKPALVQLTNNSLFELGDFRRVYGLRPYLPPFANISEPLFFGVRGKPVSPTQLHRIIKQGFNDIADFLESDNKLNMGVDTPWVKSLIAKLRIASAHWLKKTHSLSSKPK